MLTDECWFERDDLSAGQASLSLSPRRSARVTLSEVSGIASRSLRRHSRLE